MYTERKEMVRDRRNERVVRGRGIGIPRNYWKERLPGRFSLEQIAADLPAGSLISGVVLQPLIFLRFAWNSTLCSSLSLSLSLLLRDPLYRVSSTAFYSLLRKNSTRDNGGDTSLLPFHPHRPLFFSNSLLLFRAIREKGSSIEEERSRDTSSWFLTGHGNFV